MEGPFLTASSLDYEFRGKATLDTSKTLESTPPNAVPSIDYMKAAGCELAKVGYGGAISEIRQIMNQADVFYYSGHGNIYNGSINSGFTPDLLGNYWTGDLDCAVIAGCSVLNIAGHRIKSFGLSTRFKRWTWYWDETTGIPVWTRIDKGGNSW